MDSQFGRSWTVSVLTVPCTLHEKGAQGQWEANWARVWECHILRSLWSPSGFHPLKCLEHSLHERNMYYAWNSYLSQDSRASHWLGLSKSLDAYYVLGSVLYKYLFLITALWDRYWLAPLLLLLLFCLNLTWLEPQLWDSLSFYCVGKKYLSHHMGCLFQTYFTFYSR